MAGTEDHYYGRRRWLALSAGQKKMNYEKLRKYDSTKEKAPPERGLSV
jgi:hypothetical protein